MNGLLSFCTLLLVLSAHAQSFEIAGKDTVNRRDANGLRQGLWRIKNNTLKLPDYPPDQLVEEVYFVNDKMDGVRKQFYPNGVLKSVSTFVGNAARGYMKSYHPNGHLAEEGMWINASWDGVYKTYYDDGTQSYLWNFKDGKREGEQRYFLPDGSLDYIGIWKDGKELAKATPVAQPFSNLQKNDSLRMTDVLANRSKQDQLGGLNGYYNTKDKAGRPFREGFFRDGFLIEGKRYEYDAQGNCSTLLVHDARIVKRTPCL